MSTCAHQKISINYQPTVSASEHHQFPITTCHRAVNQDKLLEEITWPTQNTSHIQFLPTTWSVFFCVLFLSVASNRNCITHSFWATIPWHHFKLQLYITVWHKHNLTVTEKPKLSGSHETSASDRIWHGLSEGEEPLRQILKAVIRPWYRALFIDSNKQQGYNLMKMSVFCCGRHHIENDKYKFRGAIPWRLGVPHDISCQISTPH